MAGKGTMDYRSAGVDLDRGEREKRGLSALLSATKDANTLSELGLFGGLYAVPDSVSEPVLVSSADGVGTKLKVAFRSRRYGTVGQDLVNHCVNDILVQGARPLFFLDYLAVGHVEEGVVGEVVSGVALACRENRCALLGGETAQMPDFYGEDEFDLAGFIVGIVPRAGILDGSRVRAGDRLVAVASNGLHTNGYSLARRIVFERAGLSTDDPVEALDRPVGDVLLDVHRSYLNSFLPLVEEGLVSGLAHITGGGIPGNLPRSLPEGLGARVSVDSWTVPGVFRWLQDLGEVEEPEMRRVFNMGVGMIAVVPPDRVRDVLRHLSDAGEDAWELGSVAEGEGVEFV